MIKIPAISHFIVYGYDPSISGTEDLKWSGEEYFTSLKMTEDNRFTYLKHYCPINIKTGVRANVIRLFLVEDDSRKTHVRCLEEHRYSGEEMVESRIVVL